MCCILVCPTKSARPTLDVLRAVAAANPHGGGIAWRESGVVQYLKTDDVNELYRVAHEARGVVVIHFRIASVGGVCNELRHPFPVTRRSGLGDRSSAPAVLFQNGTWSGWRDALAEAELDGHVPPVGRMSDARAAAWLCHVKGRHDWLEETGWSRWVFLSFRELELYGDWQERDGILFSNLHWTGRDKSPPPHAQTCPQPKPAAQPARPPAEPRKLTAPVRGDCRQIGLPFAPSREFLESADRIRNRNRNLKLN